MQSRLGIDANLEPCLVSFLRQGKDRLAVESGDQSFQTRTAKLPDDLPNGTRNHLGDDLCLADVTDQRAWEVT